VSGWLKTERYPIKDGETAELAQALYDSGLLYLVNAAVLHNFGMALGVEVGDDGEGPVTGLALNLTDDPNGIWFDEDQTDNARKKMRDAGIAFNVKV